MKMKYSISFMLGITILLLTTLSTEPIECRPLAVSSAASSCNYRPAQAFLPDGFSYTAQSLYASVFTSGALYDVQMWYDNTYDSPLFTGLCIFWGPPASAPFDPAYWQPFAAPSSALGLAGPLGPLGPLSSVGPVGSSLWNPSSLLSSQQPCPWCALLLSYFRALFGPSAPPPFSPAGPLGSMGPLTPHQVYAVMYHLGSAQLANEFPANLDLPGVWGMLGPLGPLSALGLLGPLGPLSGQFSTVDPRTNVSDGVFRNRTTGSVQRQVLVQFDALGDSYRLYDLYEFYTERVALAMQDNDCSFSTQGALSGPSDRRQFVFHAQQHNQTVSVLVQPVALGANQSDAGEFCDLAVAVERLDPATGAYETVAVSAQAASQSFAAPLTGYLDFVVFRAQPGQTFRATVYAQAFSKQAPGYRLFVTGTGFLQGPTPDSVVDANLFNHMNIVGSYQSMN